MTTAELYEWLEASAWNRAYWSRVYWRANALDSDGCTAVPDYLVYTCHEHDLHYRLHTFIWGEPITRYEADLIYRIRVQQGSTLAGVSIPWVVDSLGILSPVSWVRWTWLRLFERRAWDKKLSIQAEAQGVKVIMLAGSREHTDLFEKHYARLTNDGHIVLSYNFPGEWADGEEWETGELTDHEKREIDISDEMFVINPGGIVDERTRAEIAYGRARGVKAVYLEPEGEEA